MMNRRQFFSLAAPAIVLSANLMPGHSLEKLFWMPSSYVRRYILPDGTYAYVKTFEKPYLASVDIPVNGFILKQEYGTLISRYEYERHYNAINNLVNTGKEAYIVNYTDNYTPLRDFPRLTDASWHHLNS